MNGDLPSAPPPPEAFMTKSPQDLVPGDMLYAKTTKRFALIISICNDQCGKDFIDVLALVMGTADASGGIKRMTFNKGAVLDRVIAHKET